MANRKVKGEIDQLFVILKNQINSSKIIFYDVKKDIFEGYNFFLDSFQFGLV
jgi:hypothetical protein